MCSYLVVRSHCLIQVLYGQQYDFYKDESPRTTEKCVIGSTKTSLKWSVSERAFSRLAKWYKILVPVEYCMDLESSYLGEFYPYSHCTSLDILIFAGSK